MPLLRTLITSLLAFYCLPISAIPSQNSAISRARSRFGRRTPHSVPYRPVPASVLSDYEVRSQDGYVAVSDYIVHGLSGLKHMVSRQYELRLSESFYWGLGILLQEYRSTTICLHRFPDGNPLANLTAYTNGENVRVLSMERFSNVLNTAQCSEESVKLTFTSENQFEQVESAWSWVNNEDDNYIVLVTENARCNVPDGDPTVRQPWHVKQALFNSTGNIVTLVAEPKTWQEAFQDWRLRVSSRGILPKHPQSQPGLNKRLTINHTLDIPLAVDLSGAKLTLGDDDGGTGASVACNPCYTTGSLDFDIDVVPYLIPPHLGGTVKVIANGIGASITADLSITERLTKGITGADTIFSFTPEGLGINIPDIIDIGPTLKLVAEAGIGEIDTTVDMSAGVDIVIPDGSIYEVDFDDSSKDRDSGWTPQFSPLPPQISESISISANIGTQLRLELDGVVLGIGGSVGIMLAAPTLSIEVKGIAENNACNVPGADFGVELDVELGAALDAFESGGAFDIGAAATQTLVATSMQLFSTCMTMAGAAPSAPAAPYPLGNSTVPAMPTAT